VTASRRGRGFTLVELMISLAISVVVIAGSLSLLNAQRRSFAAGSADRALQESARVAVDELGYALRMAGYGVDPGMAFDFGAATVPQAQSTAPEGVAGVTYGGYVPGNYQGCAPLVGCRDRTDGPDEIVLHFRNPFFGHKLVSATSGTLQIRGPLPDAIERGQILQVICYSGTMQWAYVRVSAKVPISPGLGDVSVNLDPGVLAADLSPTFPFQNSSLAGCGTDARVFAIEKRRYYVETYTAAGAVVPWGTAGARPYLMLDRGLVDGSNNPILTVIAPDVEDLQFAYVFPRAPAGTQLRGATVGTRLDDSAAGIDLSPANVPPVPLYSTPALDASRTSGHPANIRAVRVGLVVRQAEADLRLFEPDLPALLNRDAIVRETNRRRAVVETTIAVPNLDSHGPVFPAIGDPAVAADANLSFGGG
jgi:type IV pilus assembly protein PilW